jgi:hypothetical protein
MQVPQTYAEAMASDEAPEWGKACDIEFEALRSNDTWEYAKLPPGRQAIAGKWVFTKKLSKDGNVDVFKARYVAKGYAQRENVDYTETFSPTAKMTSMRMILQMCVDHEMDIHQMDVKSAYLNSPIDCEIFVKQPQGYEVAFDEDGKPFVCKLQKSLYGLKQSGRNWNATFSDFMGEMCFEQSKVDHCLFVRDDGCCKTLVLVWVDDIIIATKDESVMNDVKLKLSQKFQMKDLGRLKWFLGINFDVSPDYSCIIMSQESFIVKTLNKFGMTNCNPKKIPCSPHVAKLTQSDSTALPDPTLYRQIVGTLIYIMTATRPDISFAITYLSQHMTNPTKAHLNVAKQVMQYLKGTMRNALRFFKTDKKPQLIGYSDSDWGNCVHDRKSISGYCFKTNPAGPYLSWKSRK